MKLKKLISMLLCVCMLASLMPVYAFAEEGDPAACEHVYEPTETVEATCTAQGYTVYVCSLCGDSYKGDYTPVAEHTPEETAEIPATCAKEGRTAGHVCAVCGEVLDGCEPIEKTEHTPIEAAEVPPTCTEAGRTAGHVCEVCGEVLDGCDPIEATGHSPVEVAEVPPEIGKAGTTAGHICETCGEILDGCEPIDALEEETEITIEKQPEDAEPVEGEVVFSVIASVNAETEISYQWQKLDRNVTYATEAEREAAWKDMEGETSAKLRLTGLDEEEALAGAMNYAYRCVITAGEAKAVSKEVKILKPASEEKVGERSVQTGACGDNLTWTLDLYPHILTISGSGDMWNYTDKTIPWNTYGAIQELILEPGVTSIGDYAFYDSLISSAVIPEGVTRIGSNAFYSCDNLTNVMLPSSLRSIGDYAFGLDPFTEIELPSGLISIGDAVFLDCQGIESLVVPNSVTYIGEYAFSSCTNLRSAVLPSGLKVIPEGLFGADQSLNDILIPESVTSIGNSAFSGCAGLTGIVFPHGLTSFGTYVVSNCSSLTSVTLPDCVTSIERSAFSGCSSLKSVVIPSGVTVINPYVFHSLSKLTDVYFLGTQAQWEAINIMNYNEVLENVTVHYHTHSWSQAQYIWADDNSSVTATRTCTGSIVHYENELAETNCVVISEADCENDGAGTYTASFTNPAFSTQTKNAAVPATGHSYGAPEYTWADDNSSVTATRICANNSEHVETETVSTEYAETVAPTVDSTGTGVYTATFTNDAFATQSKEVEIPKLDDGTVASGTCGAQGDNLTWTLDADGVLTISGMGEMCDYTPMDWEEPNPWHSYTDSIRTVIIEQGVSSIGEAAFCYCDNLTSAIIPNSVTSIGANAFVWSEGLVNVTIPDSVRSIGNYAFYRCGIESVTIPSGVTDIGPGAFSGCKSISVAAGNNSYRSDGKALYTKDMSHILWVSPLTTGTFSIPSGVISVDISAFDGCSYITSITIPASVTSIGSSAFYRCTGLTSITIPAGVTSIGDAAFADCTGLTSITIPESVTSIGISAFTGCSSMQSATVLSSITSLSDRTFEDCSSLTSVVIPDSVAAIGESAFSGCTSLTEITLPSSVTTIGLAAFSGCTNLTDITLPSGVTDICLAAFIACSGLTDITIPENVTRIDKRTFEGCTNLTEITIPSSVTSIGDNAFEECSSLTTVMFNGTAEQWNSIAISETGNADLLNADIRFAYIASGTCGAQGDNLTWTLDAEGVLIISGTGDMADYDYQDPLPPWAEYRGTSTVVIDNGVTSIGYFAFYCFRSLTSIVIPDSVTRIGREAFEECNTLTRIVIPDYVTTIEYCTFYGCSSLTNVSIPYGVTSIEEGAFHSCESLTNISIPESVTSIGEVAFAWCRSMSSITIPDSVTIIGEKAFLGCSGLISISIPPGVVCIESGTFQDCTNLTKIVIPASVTSIGDDAFYECTSLTTVYFEGTEEQWNSITISSEGNAAILNANLIFVDPSGTIIDSGECGAEGDNLTWTLDHKGKLIISGTGDMADYYDDGPWCSYTSMISTVILSQNVTRIGAYGFFGCHELNSITIPEALTEIGSMAFGECYNMKSAGPIGSGCDYQFGWKTMIPDNAFDECYGLESVTIPDSVTYIGFQAFDGCRNLTGIILPSSLRTIGIEAFWGCRGLTEITIPSSVTLIAEFAFSNCSELTSIIIPEGYYYGISRGTFSECSKLTSVTIPAGVTCIEENAFADCISLEEVFYAGSEVEWNGVSIASGNEWLTNAVIHFLTYTVSYNANGGENAPALQAKEAGMPITLSSEVPERFGYSFLGWATKADATAAEYQPGDAYTADSSVTLYAVWQANTYTLKFNRNGGTGSAADIQITADSAEIALPKGLSRTYYTFAGWNTAADGTGASFTDTADAAELIACADEQNVITLYAQWELVHYSVRFDPNGGEGEMDDLPMQYSRPATLSANAFTRPGYAFTGWATNANGTGTKYADQALVNNLAANEGAVVTLYAQWRPNAYTIVFLDNGATSGSMANQAMTCGTAAALKANAFKRTNCTFLGWSLVPIALDDENKIPDFADKQQVLDLSVNDGDTVTLYAVWAKNCYRIVFNANGGTGDMSEESAWCEYDGNYRLPECGFDRPGFEFQGWATSAKGKVVYGDQSVVSGLSNANGKVINFYAVWTAHKYSIAFNGNGATSGTMKPLNNKACGATVTLTANAFKRNGYTFLGWSTDPNATEIEYPNKAKQTNFLTESGTLTLYAVWAPTEYAITYKNAAVSDGNYDGNPPTYTIESGIIALQPLTRPGCVFEGWYLDAKFKTPVTEIPAGSTGAKTFYAKWGGEAFTYTIVFEPNGGTGTMKPLVMACGTPKALTANAFKLTGYAFAGWNTKLDGSGTAYANKESVLNLTEEQNGTVWLYAQWTPLDYKITYKNVTANENPNPGTYNVGTGLALRNVSRPGCTFEGWYLDSRFNTSVTSIEEGHTGNVTLYAKWTVNVKVTYTIAFDSNAEGVTGTMKPMTKRVAGKDYALSANKFKRAGYEFLGWSLDPDASEPMFTDKGKVVNLAQNDGFTVVLYAVWRPVVYTITYVNVIGDNVPDKNRYTIEDETYELDPQTKQGYIFLGWYTTAAFKEGTRIDRIEKGSIGNITLYAKWQQKPAT